jgi:MarR family 2-MHQ and catechol resistance regulon transcriptional repressor
VSAEARISADHLWLVLMKCHHAVRTIAERSIQDTGLCLTDFVALEALLHKGPITITEIQDKVQLATGSMTAAVDRLEKKGFLERGSSPTDRRAKLLQLTPQGKRVVEKAYTLLAAELESAMAALNAGEKRRLYALLKKLGLSAAGKPVERG